ncbi:MAG TPA: hypothetical protein VGQ46_24130 [Thermoanaerobaculia bacterium]|jgi:hypothetical protein|nr:hypothetical protein [Thermoanaerobaculia bacterium]
MRKTAHLVVLALFLAKSSFAPGSLEVDEIASLLRQKPDLSRPFLAAYDLSTTISGVRLGGHFSRLSGGRIGPYEIQARARGSKGSYDLRVLVCTQATFVDDHGKKTEDIFDAADVKETLTGFIVQPSGGKIECPSS